MIIMALDHVRDYFHNSAFTNSPTDLSRTTVPVFFTRWITHFCAPIFVLLAGVSACLYGARKGKEALSVLLLTRGLWLLLVEMFIVTLGWTFNPLYPIFNLQVIWVTGLSMILLAAIIYMRKWMILAIALLLIGAHNLLDGIHTTGNGLISLVWSLLHEPGSFRYGRTLFSVRYPLIPWVGIIALGYSVGQLYLPMTGAKKRRQVLMVAGLGAILLFIVLRTINLYGDAASWELQKTTVLSVLSFLNTTKYPPSLLYILMTLGPALVFLSITDRGLYKPGSPIAILGSVPMFYYILHIFFIHLLALVAAALSGYHWSDMILSTRVNASPGLKGYGFGLPIVYGIWIAVILLLFPLCKRYYRYKRTHQSTKWWLSYL